MVWVGSESFDSDENSSEDEDDVVLLERGGKWNPGNLL
jgi:hypothetical protein